MTKGEFADKLCELLEYSFPNANETAREEMLDVSCQIAKWLEAFIDARIKNHIDDQLSSNNNLELGIKIFEAEMNRRYEEYKKAEAKAPTDPSQSE